MAIAWNRMLDLVFPRMCAVCGGDVGEEPGHLCWDCLAQLPLIGAPYCAWCGDPVDGRVDQAYTCMYCGRNPPFFERARSAIRYRGVVRELLRDFKYHHAFWLKKDLVRILASCVTLDFSLDEVDVVASVPLYPPRERERAYNQAFLLAEGLAKELHKPLLKGGLRRIRPTATQTHLTARDRATNVRGAFGLRGAHRLEGRKVLLVDDVMTTGATVNECARTLKEGGAQCVFVVTVARG